MNDKAIKQTIREDAALSAVPMENRQHWIVPTTIFAGLEFAVPVIMVGEASVCPVYSGCFSWA